MYGLHEYYTFGIRVGYIGVSFVLQLIRRWLHTRVAGAIDRRVVQSIIFGLLSTKLWRGGPGGVGEASLTPLQLYELLLLTSLQLCSNRNIIPLATPHNYCYHLTSCYLLS